MKNSLNGWHWLKMALILFHCLLMGKLVLPLFGFMLSRMQEENEEIERYLEKRRADL